MKDNLIKSFKKEITDHPEYLTIDKKEAILLFNKIAKPCGYTWATHTKDFKSK